MEVDCKNAKIINMEDSTLTVTFKYNSMAYNALLLLKPALKNGYCRNRTSKPRKPRTTGKKSQNHAINGYALQIAKSTGQPFDTVKMTAKYRAISRGWKYEEINVKDPKTGMMITYAYPDSEANADTIQAGYLIDELKLMADELCIKLKEYEEE